MVARSGLVGFRSRVKLLSDNSRRVSGLSKSKKRSSGVGAALRSPLRHSTSSDRVSDTSTSTQSTRQRPHNSPQQHRHPPSPCLVHTSAAQLFRPTHLATSPSKSRTRATIPPTSFPAVATVFESIDAFKIRVYVVAEAQGIKMAITQSSLRDGSCELRCARKHVSGICAARIAANTSGERQEIRVRVSVAHTCAENVEAEECDNAKVRMAKKRQALEEKQHQAAVPVKSSKRPAPPSTPQKTPSKKETKRRHRKLETSKIETKKSRPAQDLKVNPSLPLYIPHAYQSFPSSSALLLHLYTFASQSNFIFSRLTKFSLGGRAAFVLAGLATDSLGVKTLIEVVAQEDLDGKWRVRSSSFTKESTRRRSKKVLKGKGKAVESDEPLATVSTAADSNSLSYPHSVLPLQYTRHPATSTPQLPSQPSKPPRTTHNSSAIPQARKTKPTSPPSIVETVAAAPLNPSSLKPFLLSLTSTASVSAASVSFLSTFFVNIVGVSSIDDFVSLLYLDESTIEATVDLAQKREAISEAEGREAVRMLGILRKRFQSEVVGGAA